MITTAENFRSYVTVNAKLKSISMFGESSNQVYNPNTSRQFLTVHKCNVQSIYSVIKPLRRKQLSFTVQLNYDVKRHSKFKHVNPTMQQLYTEHLWTNFTHVNL